MRYSYSVNFSLFHSLSSLFATVTKMPPKRRSSPINDLPINKSRPGEERHEKSDNEMGEFEDNYEDEFESDGEVIDNANEDEDDVEVMQGEYLAILFIYSKTCIRRKRR